MEKENVVRVSVCHNCSVKTFVAIGQKRSLCPNCGKFFDRNVENNINLRSKNIETKKPNRMKRLINRRKSAQSSCGPSKSETYYQEPGKNVDIIIQPVDYSEVMESLIISLNDFEQKLKKGDSSDKLNFFYKNVFRNVDFMTYVFTFTGQKIYKELTAPYKCSGKIVNKSTNLDIDYEYLQLFYEKILLADDEVHENVIESIGIYLAQTASSTLAPSQKIEYLRSIIIILFNPLFKEQTYFSLFVGILRTICAMDDITHHIIVKWLMTLNKSYFIQYVEVIKNLIVTRLFPPQDHNIMPNISKCSFWIAAAVKILALFNCANVTAGKHLGKIIIEDSEFIIIQLDALDLQFEQGLWLSGISVFSFCQYPFILSVSAKRTILQKDAQQQMILMARKSLIAGIQNNQLPNIDSLFFDLKIRRTELINDSLSQISLKQNELKKKLKVSFVGESGLDMGGLTKEWFLLLIRKIFMADYDMFVLYHKSSLYWFNNGVTGNYQEYNLVGVLMGLAVYNGIILDIRFPSICYKKLLSPAIVPYANPSHTIGFHSATLDDLEEFDPDMAHGFREMLKYEDNDFEDIFPQNFDITQDRFGSKKVIQLKENGSNIPVTQATKQEFVELYINYMMNKGIQNQFKAFYHGFHSVCASNALLLFSPKEIEILVCGQKNIDLDNLKNVTSYENGFHKNHNYIILFWDVFSELGPKMQRRLLLFATGTDRVPIGGISEMTFKISRMFTDGHTNLLPLAHTCFNHLVLPVYSSKKELKEKLLLAIQNAEGFGLQ
ncbi:hypothetical protein SNEBB_006649 [Seison nebaliae]|nr:hypothetical protein SNEBB_006649 [Seison nebaliae]